MRTRKTTIIIAGLMFLCAQNSFAQNAAEAGRAFSGLGLGGAAYVSPKVNPASLSQMKNPFEIQGSYDTQGAHSASFYGGFEGLSFGVQRADEGAKFASVSYRLSPRIAIGAGLAYEETKLETTSQKALPEPFVKRVEIKSQLKGHETRAVLGLMYETANGSQFGISYKLPKERKLSGRYIISVENYGEWEFADGKGMIKTPEEIGLSGVIKATERLQLSGAVEVVSGSDREVEIASQTAKENKILQHLRGIAAQEKVRLKDKDSVSVAFGGAYEITEEMSWRFGTRYEEAEKMTFATGLGVDLDSVSVDTAAALSVYETRSETSLSVSLTWKF